MEYTVAVNETGKLEPGGRTAVIGLPDVGLAGASPLFI